MKATNYKAFNGYYLQTNHLLNGATGNSESLMLTKMRYVGPGQLNTGVVMWKLS